MKIRVSKAHFPVTVLGPGRRIGIWLQGCSIGCRGCVSVDTWDPAGGAEATVGELLAWCQTVSSEGGFDGVTISGGEPFEQPEALGQLLRELIAWRESDGLDFDILCYSGLPLKRLEREHAPLLCLIDVLCPEPFVEKRSAPVAWRGSSNQPLVPLTERGRRIAALAQSVEPGKRFQLDVSAGRVWFIGIPQRDDMEKVERLAAARGLELTGVSWRA